MSKCDKRLLDQQVGRTTQQDDDGSKAERPGYKPRCGQVESLESGQDVQHDEPQNDAMPEIDAVAYFTQPEAKWRFQETEKCIAGGNGDEKNRQQHEAD